MFIVPSFGFASGVDILNLLPFFLLAFFVLIISVLGIYIGIRYIQGRVFKRNHTLGTVLISLGLLYFIYSLISVVFSNLTGNTGGWLQPIIGFLWCILTIPFGLTIRNGCK